MMNGGVEWIVDAHRCDGETLSQLPILKTICELAIDELGLSIVGIPQWHQFPDPAGVTGLYLLSESHLTCHTFPETQFATFNLFCCRPLATWRWQQVLMDRLAATKVEVRMLTRQAQLELQAMPTSQDGEAT